MANTDYLRWDANTLKELITNKLTEDGTYSDQLFEGSDLSVLIDVFCYMFDNLTYLVNEGAAEAEFADAQYYENMNRIVKMLGYNPYGFATSNVPVKLGIKSGGIFGGSELVTIPEFTTFTTDLNDKNGNPIKYVFTEDYNFPVQSTYVQPNFKPILYNGTYKLYPTTFVATGIPFETFTLEGLDDVTLAHGHLKVYVKEPNGILQKWSGFPNLYAAKDKKELVAISETKNETNYEYRLNENRQYVLTFGDNVNGRQLTEGAEVSVIYLESNGPDGEIGVDVLNTAGELTVEVEGLDEDFIKDYLFDNNPSHITWGSVPSPKLPYISIRNLEQSSVSKSAEDVESIRRNAPGWFRTGARLITENDFRRFILSNWATSIFDVKVMNNWEYMTKFQSWLKDYDKLKPDIRHYDFMYGDSCDFNNIYLFLKSTSTGNVADTTKDDIEDVCNKLKPLTSEIIPVNSFNVMFTPYLGGSYDTTNWDPNYENKIYIQRDKNSMVSVEKIKQQAYQIIIDFFDLENQELGAVIDINNLYTNLMGINGVKNVQTSYLPNGSPASQTTYFDGLSFAFWTPYIVNGADLTTITGNFKLHDFQFPTLLNSDGFSNLIEVVSDVYNISNLEF